MEISINTHNVELTQRLQNHIERKTSRLDRYMPNLAEVRVDLSSQKTRNVVERQVAQVTVRDDRGTILRAEERSSDMFASVDAVIDKLYRLRKKLRRKLSRQSFAINNFLSGPCLQKKLSIRWSCWITASSSTSISMMSR